MSETECPACYQEYWGVALAESPERLKLRAQLQAGKVASIHLYTRNSEGENVCWGMHKASKLPTAPVGDTKIATFDKCPKCGDNWKPLRFFGIFDSSDPALATILDADDSEPDSFLNDDDYHNYMLILNDDMDGDDWFCNKPNVG